MQLTLPEGSEVYADSAYTNYELEDLHEECEHIRLLVERKSNSKRPDSAALRFIKKYYRKRIETSFSQITAHFPGKIHAVTPQGFLLKIVLFLFAFTLDRTLSTTWINLIDVNWHYVITFRSVSCFFVGNVTNIISLPFSRA